VVNWDTIAKKAMGGGGGGGNSTAPAGTNASTPANGTAPGGGGAAPNASADAPVANGTAAGAPAAPGGANGTVHAEGVMEDKRGSLRAGNTAKYVHSLQSDKGLLLACWLPQLLLQEFHSSWRSHRCMRKRVVRYQVGTLPSSFPSITSFHPHLLPSSNYFILTTFQHHLLPVHLLPSSLSSTLTSFYSHFPPFSPPSTLVLIHPHLLPSSPSFILTSFYLTLFRPHCAGRRRLPASRCRFHSKKMCYIYGLVGWRRGKAWRRDEAGGLWEMGS
jgi:hypothetical protein